MMSDRTLERLKRAEQEMREREAFEKDGQDALEYMKWNLIAAKSQLDIALAELAKLRIPRRRNKQVI